MLLVFVLLLLRLVPLLVVLGGEEYLPQPKDPTSCLSVHISHESGEEGGLEDEVNPGMIDDVRYPSVPDMGGLLRLGNIPVKVEFIGETSQPFPDGPPDYSLLKTLPMDRVILSHDSN